MKITFLQLSLHDKPTLILSIYMIVCAITLSVLHYILVKKQKDMKVWRLLCFPPLIACVIHFSIYSFKGDYRLTLYFYGILYISAFLTAIWQFFYKRKYLYRISAVVIHLCSIASLVMILIYIDDYTAMHNFSKQSYTEAFLSTIHAMQKEYVLSDWKEIDYDALENDILPMVEKAEREQDEIAYGAALLTYCYRFYDGHVYLETQDAESYVELCQYFAGKDYGFSMITLDSGETIAILTEENSEAHQAGIQDGTIITKWNGEPIDTAKQDVECIYPGISSFPVAQNEEYMKTIFLAGKGTNANQVSFIDDNGNEQTVTLESIGSYIPRLDMAISCFYNTFTYLGDSNFDTYMLSEDCGYLRIVEESYNLLLDSKAFITGEYPEVVSMLDQKLEDMCQQGMTKLIIDLRNNFGGMNEVSAAIASLFTTEENFVLSYGTYKHGTYIDHLQRIVPAYGKYAGLEVVTLVNAECLSAGDAIAENLSICPNVTLMGITTTNGISQYIGGVCFTSNSSYIIRYPVLLSLNEDDSPRIDTKADRIARMKLDEHIPLDAEAAKIIFDMNWENHRDYELEYAVKYLENGS